MSSPNTRSRKRSIQDIQQFHQSLQTCLSQLQTPSNPYTPHTNPGVDVNDYIPRELKSQIRVHLLKFQPEHQQYQQFTDLYLKCTQLIIQFIVRCSSQYYKHLLPVLYALLGFAESPMQCEIFLRSNYYQNQTKQEFEHVQAPMTPQYQPRGYNKRNKSKFNTTTPMGATSNCQLSVLDAFYKHIGYFMRQIKSQTPQKFGVFDMKQVLLILYHASRYAKLKIQNSIYTTQSMQTCLEDWVSNVDEKSFQPPPIGDEATAYTELFTTMEDTFDKFIKKQSSNKLRVDSDLLQIKLSFVTELLKSNLMNRRVQALSLMKSVLDKARSDDNKHKSNNETTEWSTKSHHKHRSNNNGNHVRHENAKPGPGCMLKDKCSAFILNKGLLNLLMSANYVHKNLLSRLQPIIDVLCETNQMKCETIQLLWKASENKHSTELIEFDKIYLSLSKQLPTTLCKAFYTDMIHKRFVEQLKILDQIEQIHLEFVARFTSNYIDKCSKQGGSDCAMFDGVLFLKNYAINFGDKQISNIGLRKFAFKQIQMILQKQSQQKHIHQFIIEMLHNVRELCGQMLHYGNTLSYCDTQSRSQPPAFAPVDVTYCIQGMDELLRTKFVGTTNETVYCKIADAVINERMSGSLLDLMVSEFTYWYWYCSPTGYDQNTKQWARRRRNDFQIRFKFLKTIAEKTTCMVREIHVNRLTKIPTKDKMSFYNNSSVNPDFNDKLKEMHHKHLKSWLNNCVKMNQNTRDILDKDAIKSIFKSQFQHNMDYTQFKSWLAYFHDLNRDVYLQPGRYRCIHEKEEIVGEKEMWDVIEQNNITKVRVEMIDEMIRLNLQRGNTQSNDGSDLHVSTSNGISSLFIKIDEIFRRLGQKVHTQHNISKSDFGNDTKIMRYALLLRRIMEHSIGKSFGYNKSNQPMSVRVLYRKRMMNQPRNRRTPPPRFSTFDINDGKDNDKMIKIRDKIASALKQSPARKVQLYRKAANNKFIMIEEIALLQLTYSDLAKKSNKKKPTIELEYSIIGDTRRGKHETSLAGSYALEHARFINLKQLLTSNCVSVSLSAYYVLRYLPMNERHLNQLITQCYRHPKEYFHVNSPLLTIYNLDMLRYYADMDCISQQEHKKKNDVVKKIYNRNVFKVLFDVFVHDPTSLGRHGAIFWLLWIESFKRLCYMFHDLRISFLDSPKDGTPPRLLHEYLDQSDFILHAVMNALRCIFDAGIPTSSNESLQSFDITLADTVVNTKSYTICRCFAITAYLLIHEPKYINSKKQNRRTQVTDNELQDIFIDGLNKLDNLRSIIFTSGQSNIREALYQGIKIVVRGHREHIPNSTIPLRVLDFLVGLIPTHIRDLKHHPSKFFDLLTELMSANDKHKQQSQKHINPILSYIFKSLQSCNTIRTKSSKLKLLSVLNTANILYTMMDASYHKQVDNESYIKLLIDKCLFGSDCTKPLLCPSGTPQRQKAFELLDSIIHSDPDPKQQRLIDILLIPLVEHLNITSDVIVDNIYDAEDEQKQPKQKTVANQRQSFAGHVGLVNLGSTCYLNSILQQLFMIPSFTDAILSFDSKLQPQTAGTTQGNDSSRVLHELQRLFLSLSQSHRKYVDTKKFCHQLRINNHSFDNHNQEDFLEALNCVLSQLEDNLKHIGASTHVLDDHFACELKSFVKCDNGHMSTRATKANYVHVSVPDKHTSNLLDCFDIFVEGEILEGENKYACEQCKCKVRAKKRLTISKPPKQLIIGLKRFDYNLATFQRVKVNRRVEFDKVLNIKPYLYSNFVEESKHDDEDDDEDKYIYDLVGIVIHLGTANHGHYYAYSKERSNSTERSNRDWYQFDDHKVSKKEFAAIQKDAFGGSDVVQLPKDKAAQNDGNNAWNKKQISKSKQESVEVGLSARNAYVLFYEQRAAKNEEKHKGRRVDKPWKNVKYLNEEYTRITNENNNLFRQQTLYDDAFVTFMKSMFCRRQPPRPQIHEVLIRFVFNVVPVQVHDKKEIQWWWDQLSHSVESMDLSQISHLVGSKLFPAYLMNVFGKYRNAHNRMSAAKFLKRLITHIASKRGDDVLKTLLASLIIVIKKWKPVALKSTMHEIIELIDCIWQCNESHIIHRCDALIRALQKLIEKDQTIHRLLPHDVPHEVYPQLISSDSNLNGTVVCDLMWRLIQMNTDNERYKSLNNETFCRALIAREYCESQMKIIEYIVRHNTANTGSLDCFHRVIQMVDLRMQYLDFYDVYGALNVLNRLFVDEAYLSEKLKTECIKYHLQRIIANQRYWKLMQVSLLCLSDLCKSNLVVQAWICENCFRELEQLAAWVQKNKTFKQKRGKRYQNTNLSFYRAEDLHNGDKDKQQKQKKWRNEVNNKLRGMENLQNPKESLQTAFNMIRGKQKK
eukprot:784141_1